MTRIHSMGTLSYLQGMSKREVVPWQSPNIILLIRRTHIEHFIEKNKKVVVDTKQEIKNYLLFLSSDFRDLIMYTNTQLLRKKKFNERISGHTDDTLYSFIIRHTNTQN